MRRPVTRDDVRGGCGELPCLFAEGVGAACAPAIIDPDIAALGPAKLLHGLLERHVTRTGGGLFGDACERADAAHLLLRIRGVRHCERTKPRDEVAPSHSITSSARASSVGGTVRPSALAVLRLMTNSNLVGCITGRSAGFSPLRTRPV